MTGVKHTPWEDVETESSVDVEGCTGWQDIADQSARTVAIVIGWDGWTDRDLDRRVSLIAAAPDLLETGAELQAARKAQKLSPSAENLSRVRIASDAFDAAIARARGEQDGGGHV